MNAHRGEPLEIQPPAKRAFAPGRGGCDCPGCGLDVGPCRLHTVAAPPALAELLARPSHSEALEARSDALIARLEAGWR